jgi:hypothetical protein
MKIHPLWLVCIFTRLTFIFIIKYVKKYKKILKIIPYLLLIIGFSFIYKGYFGSNNEIQINKVFWHNTRYIHGILYLISGLYLINNNFSITYMSLYTDVLFSILYRIIYNK